MRRGVRVLQGWADEMVQAYEAREAVLRDVTARALTPPESDETQVTVRWACDKPSDRPGSMADDAWLT